MVYTSSVGALGLTADGSPADERTPVRREEIVGNYKKSKYDAERVAEKWAGRGLPVVIVNPSTPVGELDIRPTPTGQMIVDFMNGRIPAYVDTGLNLVDARDVAQGHVLAAEKGRVGEKYILGEPEHDAQGNPADAGAADGPTGAFGAAAARDSACGRRRRDLRGRPDRHGRPAFRSRACRCPGTGCSSTASKAVRELGLPQTPVEEALGRAVAWFRSNGYVRA